MRCNEALRISPSDLERHAPALWLRENYGIFFRLASRLNITNAWTDVLSFQYLANRREATSAELEFANLFIPHFAKAVELSRKFAVLKARFNAMLSALDHFQIGTFVTLSEGSVLIENIEATRILDSKDGLLKTPRGVLSSIDNSLELSHHIAKVSETAVGSGMNAERVMTVKRRSLQDPYVLSICPLRDPENSIDDSFYGAIIYVIDPEKLSMVSTEGIAKLYHLTPAEDNICSMLVAGMSTEDIAESRSVSH